MAKAQPSEGLIQSTSRVPEGAKATLKSIADYHGADLWEVYSAAVRHYLDLSVSDQTQQVVRVFEQRITGRLGEMPYITHRMPKSLSRAFYSTADAMVGKRDTWLVFTAAINAFAALDTDAQASALRKFRDKAS